MADWVCYNIYADSFEQLNKLNLALCDLMTSLKKDKHLELYFFNRYVIPQKKQYYLKFGLVNGDENALSKLDDLVNAHKVRKETYACELWEVNGIPIDLIKCMSCEIFEKIRELNKNKPLTAKQLAYLLHFLMNQMGHGYEFELDLYKSMMQDIEKKLKELSQQQ